MKLSRNNWILTIVLISTFVLFAVFVILFLTSRPTLVLSDMVSYSPTTIEISSVEGTEISGSISDAGEIEQLLTLLNVQKWNSHSDLTYNKDSNNNFMCVPSYYIQINDYRIALLCTDDVEGFSKVTIREKEYLYTIPADVYREIQMFLESHTEVASG